MEQKAKLVNPVLQVQLDFVVLPAQQVVTAQKVNQAELTLILEV